MSTWYYLRTMEFHKSPTDKTPRLERVAMPCGYMDSKGRPHYYISDYQGNIRMVVDADGNVEQATDYYPNGMPMATSTGAAVNRYKYSGKELETRNGLNFYDFEARLQFHAINLFNQPDVKAGDYPWLNPYLYCAANPINITDPTGQVLQICDSNGEVFTIKIEENALTLYNVKNERVSPDDLQDQLLAYIINEDLNELIQSNIGMGIMSEVIDSKEIITLSHTTGENGFDPNTGTILYNPCSEDGGIYLGPSGYSNKILNPTIALCHEMAHAYDWVNGTFDTSTWYVIKSDPPDIVMKADIFACRVENIFRQERQLPRRISYVNNVNQVANTVTPNSKTMIPTFPLLLFKIKINSSTIII